MKLRIRNVMKLDLTDLTPETADTIESVQNCMVALFSERTAALQARIPFGNLMRSVVVLDGVRIHTVNGKDTIRPLIDIKDAKEQPPAFYLINGRLTIEPGVSPEQLRRTVAGGLVNGNLLCTDSQANLLGSIGLVVNGKINAYPDGVILREGDLTIDEGFASTAADNQTYMATGTINGLDADLDGLADRGIQFEGAGLVVWEDRLPAARRVWSGDISAIRCVPEGFAYVAGDLLLDRFALRQHGPLMYVDGDCVLFDDLSTEQLTDRLSRLIVHKKLIAPERLIDPVLDACSEYGSLLVYPGRLLRNQDTMEISAATLEGFNDPVSLYNEGYLTFEADISPELLRDKILAIYCHGAMEVPKQLHGIALGLIKEINGHLSVKDEEKPSDNKDIDPNIRVIENAMELRLV